MSLPRRHFYILPQALPRCRRSRASLARRPIQPAGAHHRCLCRRQRIGHPGAPDRPPGCRSGSARPSSSRTGGAGAEYRHRGGSEGVAGRLHAAHGRPANPSTMRSTTTLVSISSAILRRSPEWPRAVCLVVDPSLPAKTVPEFIAYGRPTPTSSTWPRPASAPRIHMSGELFKMMAGVNMVHVPYRGADWQ